MSVLQEQVLTVDELAAFLKVSTRTIYRMLDENEIPCGFKVKGSWRFRMNDIHNWIGELQQMELKS